MKRSSVLAALAASTLLAACKEPPQAADSKIANSFVTAGDDIAIESLRTYGTNDGVAGAANEEYYVIRFKWTNDLGFAATPKVDHFIIADAQGKRYLGVDSGNLALVGISNYEGLLARGESHDYTVGFRVPVNTQGTLLYDASF